MKKILALVLFAVTFPVLAQPHHHGYWRHGGDGRWFWMAPLIVGGAVVYEVTRPQTVVQQPVIIQNPPQSQPQSCSPWTETQNSDGTITRTRTCTQ